MSRFHYSEFNALTGFIILAVGSIIFVIALTHIKDPQDWYKLIANFGLVMASIGFAMFVFVRNYQKSN